MHPHPPLPARRFPHPRLLLPLLALLAAAPACQRLRRPPAHGTVRARSTEVFLDGLRPVLVVDLRVEVIGALPDCLYDVGPVFAASTADGGTEWVCRGDACSHSVDTDAEYYPLELRLALDQAATAPGLRWPLEVRFEIRERDPSGRSRTLASTESERLDAACGRLARVPLTLRVADRIKAGPEGELAVDRVTAQAGCEGPVLHAELSHRVLPLAGTRPVVRLDVGTPGFETRACAGPFCEVPLEPPDRGSVVIDKPLGAGLAALGRPVARAQVHLYLERRSVDPDEPLPPDTPPLDHHVFDLISPGAGGVGP